MSASASPVPVILKRAEAGDSALGKVREFFLENGRRTDDPFAHYHLQQIVETSGPYRPGVSTCIHQPRRSVSKTWRILPRRSPPRLA